MRYFMTFSYDGSDFCGYQKQPSGRTVQGELESVLRKINGEKEVSVVASGRTDAGVHAMNQKAHFIAPFQLLHPYLIPYQKQQSIQGC